MGPLRCDHDQQLRRRAAGHEVDVGAVTIADRRHVHAWVPVADVPQHAPDELAAVAVAVSGGDQIVGWWFDVPAALAAGDTDAGARFAKWAAQFTRRTLLGEASTVDAAIGVLAAAVDGHLDAYVEGRFCALGGTELDAFIGCELAAELAAERAAGDVVELTDTAGAPIPARVWRTEGRLTLTETDTVSVGVDDTGMWCEVGDAHLAVCGWRIDGETGDVVIDTGDGTRTLDGAAGTAITRQAPGQVAVRVQRRRFAEVCSELSAALYDAADTAAGAGRYLLIGVEPAPARRS